ncbi:MAG: cytochrome C, partial [Campylobacteraceae bacterium]|nr:cytochrome C [Campylobacteraceae bacterium]
MRGAIKLFLTVFTIILISTFSHAKSEFERVMKERGLSEEDAISALKVYNPSGVHDEYYAFASGGQSGQVIVYGVPSM